MAAHITPQRHQRVQQPGWTVEQAGHVRQQPVLQQRCELRKQDSMMPITACGVSMHLGWGGPAANSMYICLCIYW